MFEVNGVKKSLGLCMIVKDERKELEKLFRSLRPVSNNGVFDKVVICITGDHSNEYENFLNSFSSILPIKVIHFTWIDDFSAARQASFDACDTDYIMWLDSDDTLIGVNELIPVCIDAFLNPAVYAIFMQYEYDHDKDGNCCMLLWRERIIKKGSHQWRGAIHESLLPVIDGCNYRTDKVIVSHNIDLERVGRSGTRNLRISEKEYRKEREPNHGAPDPRTTLYYAKALHATGRFAESIPVFEEYLETSEWDDERYQVFLILGVLYVNSKQYHKALDCATQAIRLRSIYGQAYYLMGQIYFHMERYEEVIHFCEIGARSKMPSEIIPTDPSEYSLKPILIYEYALFQQGRAHESLRAIDIGLRQFPSSEQLKDRKKSVMAYLSRMEMEDAAHKLCHWLETYEADDTAKMGFFLCGLPKPVADHPKYIRLANEHGLTTATDSANRIAIYCGGTFETWGPDDVKTKGLGGSEEAVVYLSRELVKLGWCVDVYSNCTEPGQYDGVNYFNHWTWRPEKPYDIFIAWRNSEYIELAPENSKKYLWLHDVQKMEYYTPERIAKIDKIMVLSKWHRDNLKEIPDDKFFITRNGIVSRDFAMAGTLPRDPYKCVYASSPDRGLDILLTIWPKIREKVPDAHLHIFYGFTETYDKLHANRDRMIQYKEQILKLMNELDGVHYHGKVNHAELHMHLMSSGLWLYPTHFTEISCITAMKAQAAGAVPVTMTIAALDETVRHGYKIIFPIADTRSVKAFENITVDLLTNHEKQEKIRVPMMRWAKDFFDWSLVAKEWDALFKETSDVLTNV